MILPGQVYESRDPRDNGRRVVVRSIENERYARICRVGIAGGELGYRIQQSALRKRFTYLPGVKA